MRSTGNKPDYIRHTFILTKRLKSYTVYELSHVVWNKNLLTDIIRIEKFQGKSKATKIDKYLRLRNTSNWKTSEMVTGLRPAVKYGLFYGDRCQITSSNTVKKTLLIFQFLNDRETLIIDVYRGFYPNHNGILKSIINTY